MEPLNFTKAYYIKLGKGGNWEESSIQENKARIGWLKWPLEEINRKEWDALKKKFQNTYKSKGAATADMNALQCFVESTSDDIWITFHKNQLWWCRLGDTDIQEDNISKFRNLLGGWHNQDIHDNLLMTNQIPGSIEKIQGFRATICTIKEVGVLRRLINGEPSDIYNGIRNSQKELMEKVKGGLEQLHWKDFEILVDLLFHSAGWRRISLLGKTMKNIDMVLQEQITGDKYQVQVKSEATIKDFEQWIQKINHDGIRKSYFVVHSPDERLLNIKAPEKYKNIEILLPARIAEMVVNFGLTDWLLAKIK